MSTEQKNKSIHYDIDKVKELVEIEKDYSSEIKSLEWFLCDLHKYIDPYEMEYIRHSAMPLWEVMYQIKDTIDDIFTLKKRMSEDHFNVIPYMNYRREEVDVRNIVREIGAEPYGRTFKFLEKMHIRFKDDDSLLFLHKLKYRSHNSPLNAERRSLQYKVQKLESKIEELTVSN